MAQSQLKPVQTNNTSREQAARDLIDVHKDAIAVIQKLWELTGQPDLKPIIDRSHRALGIINNR